MAGIRRYETDVSDEQWARIQAVVERGSGLGRPPTVDRRAVVNALQYMTRTGCQWRLLPKEFPTWSTVRYYFDIWTWDHRLEELNTLLRQEHRVQAGRQPEPSAAVLDSQSVKTTEAGGDHGYDGGKKINGRKRFVLVDTVGNVLLVKVTAADSPEREGARLLLWRQRDALPRLARIWADSGYDGEDLRAWVANELGCELEIVRPPEGQRGFQIHQRRWVVEQTFGCLSRCRRLSKDYEHLTKYSESWFYLASIQRLLNRVERSGVAELSDQAAA